MDDLERVREVLARELPRLGLYGALGFELVSLDTTGCTLRIALAERHLNFARMVHGGVTTALADTAIGLAFLPGTTARSGLVSPTVSLTLQFLDKIPASTAELRATGRVLRAGRRTGFGEAQVEADGKLVAKALGAVALVELKPAP